MIIIIPLVMLSMLGVRAAASNPVSLEIRVNASYSARSLWTESEIRDRFVETAATFAHACPGVRVVLGVVHRIEEEALQDIDGSLVPGSTSSAMGVLSHFSDPIKPTLMYVRKGKWDIKDGLSQFTEDIAKAYILGGPRSLSRFRNFQLNDFNASEIPSLGWQLGNLDWQQLDEFRDMHGVIVIGEGGSKKSLNADSGLASAISTDRHELGHVFLNDGSHRETVNNVMAGVGLRTTLDQDQCELIRSYIEMEKLRDAAILSGMHNICSLYEEKKMSPKPNYCPSN